MWSEFTVQGQIPEWFSGDLILRWTFELQILPNSKKLWISMQRALLYRHFIVIEITYSSKTFLELGQICV